MGYGVYGWQYEMIACPFCESGQISCKYFPSSVSISSNRTASLPGKGSVHKSKEVWIVLSGCPQCKKTRDEVEEELKKKGLI
jgi:hypothetical protein